MFRYAPTSSLAQLRYYFSSSMFNEFFNSRGYFKHLKYFLSRHLVNFDSAYSKYLRRELLNPTFYKMPPIDVRARRSFDLSEIYCLRRRGKFRKYLNFLKKYTGVPRLKRLSKHNQLHFFDIARLVKGIRDQRQRKKLQFRNRKYSYRAERLKSLINNDPELKRYFLLRKRGFLKYKRKENTNTTSVLDALSNKRMSIIRYRGKKRVPKEALVYLRKGEGYDVYPERHPRGRFYKGNFIKRHQLYSLDFDHSWLSFLPDFLLRYPKMRHRYSPLYGVNSVLKFKGFLGMGFDAFGRRHSGYDPEKLDMSLVYGKGSDVFKTVPLGGRFNFYSSLRGPVDKLFGRPYFGYFLSANDLNVLFRDLNFWNNRFNFRYAKAFDLFPMRGFSGSNFENLKHYDWFETKTLYKVNSRQMPKDVLKMTLRGVNSPKVRIDIANRFEMLHKLAIDPTKLRRASSRSFGRSLSALQLGSRKGVKSRLIDKFSRERKVRKWLRRKLRIYPYMPRPDSYWENKVTRFQQLSKALKGKNHTVRMFRRYRNRQRQFKDLIVRRHKVSRGSLLKVDGDQLTGKLSLLRKSLPAKFYLIDKEIDRIKKYKLALGQAIDGWKQSPLMKSRVQNKLFFDEFRWEHLRANKALRTLEKQSIMNSLKTDDGKRLIRLVGYDRLRRGSLVHKFGMSMPVASLKGVNNNSNNFIDFLNSRLKDVKVNVTQFDKNIIRLDDSHLLAKRGKRIRRGQLHRVYRSHLYPQQRLMLLKRGLISSGHRNRASKLGLKLAQDAHVMRFLRGISKVRTRVGRRNTVSSISRRIVRDLQRVRGRSAEDLLRRGSLRGGHHRFVDKFILRRFRRKRMRRMRFSHILLDYGNLKDYIFRSGKEAKTKKRLKYKRSWAALNNMTGRLKFKQIRRRRIKSLSGASQNLLLQQQNLTRMPYELVNKSVEFESKLPKISKEISGVDMSRLRRGAYLRFDNRLRQRLRLKQRHKRYLYRGRTLSFREKGFINEGNNVNQQSQQSSYRNLLERKNQKFYIGTIWTRRGRSKKTFGRRIGKYMQLLHSIKKTRKAVRMRKRAGLLPRRAVRAFDDLELDIRSFRDKPLLYADRIKRLFGLVDASFYSRLLDRSSIFPEMVERFDMSNVDLDRSYNRNIHVRKRDLKRTQVASKLSDNLYFNRSFSKKNSLRSEAGARFNDNYNLSTVLRSVGLTGKNSVKSLDPGVSVFHTWGFPDKRLVNFLRFRNKPLGYKAYKDRIYHVNLRRDLRRKPGSLRKGRRSLRSVVGGKGRERMDRINFGEFQRNRFMGLSGYSRISRLGELLKVDMGRRFKRLRGRGRKLRIVPRAYYPFKSKRLAKFRHKIWRNMLINGSKLNFYKLGGSKLLSLDQISRRRKSKLKKRLLKFKTRFSRVGIRAPFVDDKYLTRSSDEWVTLDDDRKAKMATFIPMSYNLRRKADGVFVKNDSRAIRRDSIRSARKLAANKVKGYTRALQSFASSRQRLIKYRKFTKLTHKNRKKERSNMLGSLGTLKAVPYIRGDGKQDFFGDNYYSRRTKHPFLGRNFYKDRFFGSLYFKPYFIRRFRNLKHYRYFMKRNKGMSYCHDICFLIVIAYVCKGSII